MENPLTPMQRRRLEAGITARIRQLQYFRRQLSHVDRKILTAGMDYFESEADLADWICQPAPSLGGKVPLTVMKTAKGRATVATALVRISPQLRLTGPGGFHKDGTVSQSVAERRQVLQNG